MATSGGIAAMHCARRVQSRGQTRCGRRWRLMIRQPQVEISTSSRINRSAVTTAQNTVNVYLHRVYSRSSGQVLGSACGWLVSCSGCDASRGEPPGQRGATHPTASRPGTRTNRRTRRRRTTNTQRTRTGHQRRDDAAPRADEAATVKRSTHTFELASGASAVSSASGGVCACRHSTPPRSPTLSSLVP